MGEYGDLYARGRERIIELVSAADILAGNLEGAPGDPWTAAQVDVRRDKTVDEIVNEWRETGPQIDGMIDSFGPSGAQLLFEADGRRG